MQSLRQNLTLLLLAALPFHAFLVTVGTKVFVGPNQAPLTSFALWKEAVLVLILTIACKEIVQKAKMPRLDMFDWLILTMLILSVMVTAMTHGDWKLFAFGFKYDFIPLVAFVVLRRVQWSQSFKENTLSLLLFVGGIVAALGIVSLLLPASVFTWFGYSDLHSLYVPGGPLAAFQQIESLGVRRIQSTMSGPNQLGLWLLIPWSIALLQRKKYAVALIFTALLLTFSRSAWIASGVILIVVLWKGLPRKVFYSALGGLFSASLLAFIVLYFFAPDIVMRTASNADHLARPLEAIEVMKEHPLGLGLGTAGPASNRVSDACVHLPEGSDASWASDRLDLCVFTGDIQVQPHGRVCNCPLLPENWYLQMGVEMGILGFVLFLTLIIFVLLRLRSSPYALLPLLGISIAALFLHAWEGSAVAYTTWILTAMSLKREQCSLKVCSRVNEE
jgi:O-antigen ligase